MFSCLELQTHINPLEQTFRKVLKAKSAEFKRSDIEQQD